MITAKPREPMFAAVGDCRDALWASPNAGRRSFLEAAVGVRGVKSWLLKQAVELLAVAIRKGNYLVDLLLGQLDAKAAKAFRKYADKIADGLDDIAQIPDLTMTIVREKLRYFLTNELRMNPGTAEVIVGAVETVLGVLL